MAKEKGRRTFLAISAFVSLWVLPYGNSQAAEVFATGLVRPYGSSVGPGGDLYVADAAVGAIVRIDSRTGETSVYADGLPISPLLPFIGIGGVMDVTFIEGTAYALVTIVGSDIGGTETVGIYRLEEDGTWAVVADIGSFAAANPPAFPFDLPTGVQYAIENFRGSFLVTDGNHNRVLHVTRDGDVSEAAAFGNVVPTGLAVRGNSAFLALAGPVPHFPEDGKVLVLDPRGWEATELGSGAPLLVDVEVGRGTSILALSQGDGIDGAPAGAPAVPDTGSVVRLNADGTFTTLSLPINLPTSMAIIRNAAYVVTLPDPSNIFDEGKVYRIPNITGAPFGEARGRR